VKRRIRRIKKTASEKGCDRDVTVLEASVLTDKKGKEGRASGNKRTVSAERIPQEEDWRESSKGKTKVSGGTKQGKDSEGRSRHLLLNKKGQKEKGCKVCKENSENELG